MKIIKQNKIKAFTLIELLVVIAIIAILSGVVIVNLNSARQKGQDAAIKNQMAQVRSSSAVYQDVNNYFSTVNIDPTTTANAGKCSTSNTLFTSPNIAAAIIGLTNNSGNAPWCTFGTSSNAQDKADSWIMFSKLRSSATQVWCIDSSGNAKTVTVTSAATQAIATLNSNNEVVCP